MPVIKDKLPRRVKEGRSIHTLEEFKKIYFPVRYEAEKVAKMNKDEYLKWFMNTPEEHLGQVIKELHRIADECVQIRSNIMRNLGY